MEYICATIDWLHHVRNVGLRMRSQASGSSDMLDMGASGDELRHALSPTSTTYDHRGFLYCKSALVVWCKHRARTCRVLFGRRHCTLSAFVLTISPFGLCFEHLCLDRSFDGVSDFWINVHFVCVSCTFPLFVSFAVNDISCSWVLAFFCSANYSTVICV